MYSKNIQNIHSASKSFIRGYAQYTYLLYHCVKQTNITHKHKCTKKCTYKNIRKTTVNWF